MWWNVNVAVLQDSCAGSQRGCDMKETETEILGFLSLSPSLRYPIDYR